MGRYEYHYLNALGSNIVLTDDNQNVLVRYEYDVFGAIRAETGTSDNTRKFTGKEWDADSNLYYFAARYYDPYIGRFTQRDPAGDGVNWYTYTYNNPLRFIDPSGLVPLAEYNPGLYETASDFFGDMIHDLGKVEIKGALPGLSGYAITVHNNIYIDPESVTNSIIIHELVHVWQYQRGRIEPVTAGLSRLAEGLYGAARGNSEMLYNYTLDKLTDPNRRALHEYTFEQQAQIIEDAFKFVHLGLKRKNQFEHNQNFDPADIDYWREYYETIIEEFKEWHNQLLQESSSRHYMEYN